MGHSAFALACRSQYILAWESGRKIGAVIFLGIAAVVSYGLYQLSGLFVRTIQAIARERPALLAQFGDLQGLLAAAPSIAFTSISIPILLTSASFALSTFYLATDLDLLVVTPAPMRAVFLARFIEGLIPIYLFLFVLLLPALAGYGLALGYGVGYIVALPPVLALLPLLPMSIGVLLTMVLARIIPPRRLRELMAILGGLLGFFVYIGTQVLSRSSRDIMTTESATRLLRLDIQALPTAWGARLLVAVGRGDGRDALVFGIPYVLATLGLFGLALLVTERLYYSGWIGLAGSQGGRVRRRRATEAWRWSWFQGPTGAILRKDLRTLPRDPQRLSQLLFPLALSAFWAWQILFMRTGRFGGVMASLTSITLLVCLLIASNLGLTSLSREGTGYWVLQLAPIGPWPILWAKWTLAFLPFPIIATLFTVLAALLRNPPAGELVQSLLVVVLTGIGVSGITTGFGAAFPRFDWSQAQRMTSLRAGCLAPLAYYVYAGLMLLLTFGASMVAREWGPVALVAGWTSALLITALALVLPLWLAATRLRRLEI